MIHECDDCKTIKECKKIHFFDIEKQCDDSIILCIKCFLSELRNGE